MPSIPCRRGDETAASEVVGGGPRCRDVKRWTFVERFGSDSMSPERFRAEFSGVSRSWKDGSRDRAEDSPYPDAAGSFRFRQDC
jgi:hypothetical protein